MAATERSELTPEAEQRITTVIRSLADDHIDRGIDLNRPMRCDSCSLEKSALGSSQYGAYALCNDCLLEFTLALARGDVANVAEYMTRRPDDADNGAPALSDPVPLESRRSRELPVPKPGDKLMPSNEPC